MRRNALLFAILVSAAAARAQEDGGAGEARPPKDNIGHARHLHRHNPPHPKEPPGGPRFTTSRDAAAVLPLPHEQDAFFFVVFGDRTGGPVEGVSVLADAVRDANLLEPDLVMTVGDLVEGYNQSDKWLEQMREYKSIMDQLICPWFPVSGNHDIYWRGPKGAEKPAGEHERDYETHFGPLWYAFEHKNCWFIALYSDEGNPETGEKNFNKPECQRMSDEQFNWLRDTLARAEGADHVFLFLHHPRWLGGKYGDDWDRVHGLLKQAGNVSAVFAGHIHHLRYDGPKDGIEYVTLATVGGGQSGKVPSAGYLHQFHVVTVRKSQLAMAAIPVGKVMDVREITGEMVAESEQLAAMSPRLGSPLKLAEDGSARGVMTATVTNPISRPIEVLVTPESRDSRWFSDPDHNHRTIAPGESFEFEFAMRRLSASLDAAFQPAELVVQIEYLGEGFRYPMPEKRVEVPMIIDLHALPRPAEEIALRVDGSRQCLYVPSDLIQLPDGPLTLECWFSADDFEGRTGLVTKTENSDYGIFVSDGVPTFSLLIGDSYVTVKSDKPMLEMGRWTHVAGVFDGKQTRLYVNGELITSVDRSGARRRNALPLYIGADVTGAGGATSHFDGMIDGVRLSATARYAGERFTPERRFEADDQTVLLFNMDGAIGPWVFDESASRAHAKMIGAPDFVPASRR